MVAIILPRPMLKVAGRKTHDSFTVATPKESHFVDARCEEVACPHHEFGWITSVPTVSEQAGYIRYVSGRDFVERKASDNNSAFHFKPGQQCFRQHFRKLERGPWLFVVNGGAVTPHQFKKGLYPQFAERQGIDWDDWRDQMDEHSYRYNRWRGVTT